MKVAILTNPNADSNQQRKGNIYIVTEVMRTNPRGDKPEQLYAVTNVASDLNNKFWDHELTFMKNEVKNLAEAQDIYGDLAHERLEETKRLESLKARGLL